MTPATPSAPASPTTATSTTTPNRQHSAPAPRRTGPAGRDLAPGTRFGQPPGKLDAFTRAYGYDPRAWEGLPVLIAIRDLHTLGSFIRRADTGDAQAAMQLQHRLDTLRSGDTTTRWDIF